MKHLTMKHWVDMGGTDEEWKRSEETANAYDAYIAQIRHLLPTDLQRLAGMGGDISLNDGVMCSFDASLAEQKLHIILNGAYYQHGTEGRERTIYLTYTDVDSIHIGIDATANYYRPKESADLPVQDQIPAAEDLGADGSDEPAGYGSLFHASGYGDHGFDEVDVLENGLFEHRMLFSSGNEIAIRFRGFSLSYEDH